MTALFIGLVVFVVLLALGLVFLSSPTSDKKIDEHDLIRQINSLDLKPIENLLSVKNKWDQGKIDLNIGEYKKFLFLIGVNPGQTIVPWNDDVDEVWHMHILDSAKYRKDCIEIFGRIIDHNPHLYVGLPLQVQEHKKTQRYYRDLKPSTQISLEKRTNNYTSSYYDTTPFPVHTHNSCDDGLSKGSSCGASCSSSSSDSGGSSCGGGASCGCGGGCGGA